VRFLQQQPWVDVVFTRGGTGGQGTVAGTLSFDITKGSHPSRAPDVTASLSWTSSRNAFGVPGAQTIHSTAGGASRPPGSSGPIASGASGHGGLSPWVVRNTLVLWGHDFKSRARVVAPASLADLMPTALKVLALEADRCDSGCGRVLEEALRSSPDRRLTPRQRTVTTASGAYRASVRLSSVAGHDYVDQGSRGK
jgi:hypothetical protein